MVNGSRLSASSIMDVSRFGFPGADFGRAAGAFLEGTEPNRALSRTKRYLGPRKCRISETSNRNADKVGQELKSRAHCRATLGAENAFDLAT